jgi:glycosyltransferase involved in cell wall biosynthesis
LRADRPRVGIFVQAYNTARYIGECLESVLAQGSGYALDVLVIDDASPDGTVDEVRRFGDRVRLVRHQTNTGATATANEGYAAVGGEFVMRLDSDDRLRPGFLDQTVPVLTAHPEAGLVYSDVALIDEAGQLTQSRTFTARTGSTIGDEFFPLLTDNYIPAPSTLVRRTALAAVLPIPATLTFVDWYVSTGIAERWDCAYVDAVLADYRVHSQSMHHTMVRDCTGEQSSARILDARFADPHRADEKRRWHRRVYGRHYLSYADKYFGSRMNGPARRCYLAALRQQPSQLWRTGLARRLAATLVGRRAYDAVKAPWVDRPSAAPR